MLLWNDFFPLSKSLRAISQWVWYLKLWSDLTLEPVLFLRLVDLFTSQVGICWLIGFYTITMIPNKTYRHQNLVLWITLISKDRILGYYEHHQNVAKTNKKTKQTNKNKTNKTKQNKTKQNKQTNKKPDNVILYYWYH